MPLNPCDLATLSRLIDEGWDVPAAELEAWLAALPAEHAHLRDQLREMILSGPAQSQDMLARGPRLAGMDLDEIDVVAGDRVGPYRLIRELGRGGMGKVWLADRAEDGVRRQVALKLPRLAWDDGLADRMRRERDIGALLEHPNIARLYDAGVDDKGRPYLAFEYVAGQALDAWSTARTLPIRDRLQLFLQVAGAVAYAHGRLVVHRDLKPSNVLVSEDGVAHLLDFGISKLLAEDAVGDSPLTQERGRMLTPHYASPEQLTSGLVTVASDVYSLGVLLYELLTGVRPFEGSGRSVAALEEAVLRGDPPFASSRVADKTAARKLRGELDAILAKALRLDPAQRYPTADAFAQDVERHLVGELVQARPDSVAYRWSKLARRHRTGLSAVSAVCLAVLVGSVVSTWQLHRAARAADRERVVREFVTEVFRANGRGASGEGVQRPGAPEDFVEGSARLIETRFTGQPDMQAELYEVVGGVFFDMGAYPLAIQYWSKQIAALKSVGVGRADDARAALQLARALLEDSSLDAAESEARRALALSVDDTGPGIGARVLLARVLYAQRRPADLVSVLADIDKRLGGDPSVRSIERAWVIFLRGRMLVNDNHLDEAIPLEEKAVEMAEQSEGPLSMSAVDMRLEFGNYLAQTSRDAEARRFFEPAIAVLRSLGSAHAIRAAQAKAYFAWRRYWSGGNGTLVEAMDTISRSRSVVEKTQLAVPTWFLAQDDFMLSSMKIESGEISRALPDLIAAGKVLDVVLKGPADRYVLAGSLGNALMYAGDHAQADRWYREELQMVVQMRALQHPYTATTYHHIAENLMMQGRFAQAEQVLDGAPHFDPIRGYGDDNQRYNRFLTETRAQILLAKGDARGALALVEGDPPQTDVPAGDDGFDRTRMLLGELLCANGQPEKGLPMLQRWLSEDERSEMSPDAPWLARLRAVTGACALQTGDRSLAQHLGALARKTFDAQPGVSEYYKAPLVKLEYDLR